MKDGFIRIGFWKDFQNPMVAAMEPYPDPQKFVDHAWPKEHREIVALYLEKAGRVHNCYMGYSYCRFECGIDDREMGCQEFTDGTYLWPEGLSHYVRVHHVRVPGSFIEHMVREIRRMAKEVKP